jgi:thioredoxin-like negative regulator of GroEL
MPPLRYTASVMNAIATLDQFDFHHLIGVTQGPALVLFHSPGCASCRHWKRLLADYAVLHDNVTLYQIDIQRDMALAHEFGLFHLPALFLYLNGQFHCELQSEARMEDLNAALDAAMDASPQEAP